MSAAHPAGSSSGAAVSVVDGMCHGAIGTDTGGSCRIPAAFCGCVGFKPSQYTVPRHGFVPLAPSLDTVGPLARTVECCAILFATISGRKVEPIQPVASPRLAIPRTLVLNEVEDAVATAFERAVSIISDAGIDVHDQDFACFRRAPQLTSRGGFAAAESYPWHAHLLRDFASAYDPRVAIRIRQGALFDEADRRDLVSERMAFMAEVSEAMRPYDAIALPTAAIVPPRLHDLSADSHYDQSNRLALRNTGLINLADGCAISLPIHREGEPPVGLMLACRNGKDEKLVAIAARVEKLLAEALGRMPAQSA